MWSISRTESPPDKPGRLIRRSIAGTPRLNTGLDNSTKETMEAKEMRHGVAGPPPARRADAPGRAATPPAPHRPSHAPQAPTPARLRPRPRHPGGRHPGRPPPRPRPRGRDRIGMRGNSIHSRPISPVHVHVHVHAHIHAPGIGNSRRPKDGAAHHGVSQLRGMRPRTPEAANPGTPEESPPRAPSRTPGRASRSPAPPGPRSAVTPTGWVPRCPRCVVRGVRRPGGIMVAPV